MSILSTLIYRVDIKPDEIKVGLFFENCQVDFKIYMAIQRIEINQKDFEKEKQCCRIYTT